MAFLVINRKFPSKQDQYSQVLYLISPVQLIFIKPQRFNSCIVPIPDSHATRFIKMYVQISYFKLCRTYIFLLISEDD